MSNGYILVTPCKNEEENLSNLISSVASQTVRPVIWVIVDDGSTDKTPQIIEKSQKEYIWIRSIRTTGEKRDRGLHLADVMKTGFDHAITYCEKNEIAYDYLGNIDGDLTVQSVFFENLIREFGKNPKLGMASGGTDHIIGEKIVRAKVSVDEPSGGHMLIRKECFTSCGGIPLSYAVDSVLKAKVRLKGWETRRFENNIALEIRDTGSSEGYWKGYLEAGKAAYFININPFHIFLKSILFVYKIHIVSGIAYLVGYFGDLIKRKEQFEDDEIKKYFWNKWKQAYKHYKWGIV